MEAPIRILVAGSDVSVVSATTRALERAGYESLYAASGSEAMRLLKASRPQLVLLEAKLPDMSGLELCRHIKNTKALSHAFVILTSVGEDWASESNASRSLGVDGYLTLPSPEAELLSRLDSYLRMQRLTVSLRERVDELNERNLELTRARDEAEKASRELKLMNETLLASRVAALNLIEDAVEAKTLLENANQELEREISERKQVEAALRESEERWKFALEGTGDGVWDWDIVTNEAHFSRAWKDMLGYSDEEIGPYVDEWNDRVHPDDLARALAQVEAHLAGNFPAYVSEHRLRCKDGQYKWILDRGMVTSRDAQGNPLRMVGTMSDLTAIKQAEADRMVVSKLESTGILAGGVAHDFNNLLTGILMNVGMLKTGPNTPAETTLSLKEIEEAALAACSITRKLVVFARGGSAIRRETNLSGELRTQVALALSRSNVRGEISIEKELWRVEVDPEQIGQVIRSMVNNSREATPDGGVVRVRADNVVLTEETVPKKLRPGRYVRISVIDHGRGIPAEILPKVFDPYFSTKPRGAESGMGLGLTMCHSVIQKHAGAITVRSEPDKETVFAFYLPALPSQS